MEIIRRFENSNKNKASRIKTVSSDFYQIKIKFVKIQEKNSKVSVDPSHFLKNAGKNIFSTIKYTKKSKLKKIYQTPPKSKEEMMLILVQVVIVPRSKNYRVEYDDNDHDDKNSDHKKRRG